MVRVIHIRVVSELHAFGPLRDHADARFIHDADRFAWYVPPGKNQTGNCSNDPVAIVSPSGNTLSQGFERRFHFGILNDLLDGLLSHTYLHDHILPDFTA